MFDRLRSLVAMLLGTGILIGFLRGTTRGVSEVWQVKDLERGVFGSVAMAGLTR
jgi:hypothetical protein